MDRTRLLQALGVLVVAAGGLPLRLAFKHPMCANLSSGGSCAPNIAYLLPGLLVALAGIGLVVVGHRRRSADDPTTARA